MDNQAYSLLPPKADSGMSSSPLIRPDLESAHMLPGHMSNDSVVRTISRNVDNGIQFSTATHEGHDGDVLCVDASDDGNFIITGGDDRTLRVWQYFDDIYACFKLVSVLRHEGRVTNNAFVGTSGPIVGADSTGAFVVWPMDSGTFGKTQSAHRPTHGNPITEVSVKKAYTDDGSIYVATASSNTGRLSVATAVNKNKYVFKSMAHLEHHDDVLHIKHIPGSVSEGTAVATCTAKAIKLWSLDGQLSFTLEQSTAFDFTCLSVSMKEDEDVYHFLMASAGPHVFAWALRRGHVVSGTGVAYKPGEVKPQPLVQYEVPAAEMVTDVAVSPDNTYIIVAKQARDRYSSEKFCITATEGGGEKLGLSEPANLLLKALPTSDFEVEHDGAVRAVTVYTDPDGEATLLEAFSNGLAAAWDLTGVDKGNLTIELRSLTPLEVILPILLLLVSFFQVSSFAFGPNTNWSEEVQKPANFTASIAFVDVEVMVSIDAQFIFWPEILGALGMMLLFILLAVFGVPEAISVCRRDANRLRYTKSGFVLRWFEIIVKFLMATVATILVVPLYTTVAKTFDCFEHEDGYVRLREATGILCYEGRHQQLTWAIYAIAPVFFLVLVPHFCVQGDTQYVSRKQLFSPWMWRESVERQASTIYNHMMHPYCDNVYLNRFFELLAKIALPSVTILLRTRPRMQMLVVCCIGACLYIQSLVHKALADPVWAAAKACSHLCTFVAMLCGLASTIFPDYRDWTTVWLLSGEFSVFLLGAMHLHAASRYRAQRSVLVEASRGELENDDDFSPANSVKLNRQAVNDEELSAATPQRPEE